MRIGLFYQIQVPKPWSPTSEAERIYEAVTNKKAREKLKKPWEHMAITLPGDSIKGHGCTD